MSDPFDIVALRYEVLGMTECTEAHPATMLLVDELPLLHRCGDPTGIAEAVQAGDNQLRPRDGSRNRGELGLRGNVFFWIGHCAYDPSPLVFVWTATAEQGKPAGRGAPWDTGGILTKNTLGRQLGVQEALVVIEKYSLPVPQYRDYMGLVIAACFERADRYLAGESPSGWYPGRKPNASVPDDAATYTFEFRTTDRFGLAPDLLAVVADPTAFAGVPRAYRALRSFGRSHAELGFLEDTLPVRVANDTVRRYLKDRGHE
jgi:hypothetical protein